MKSFLCGRKVSTICGHGLIEIFANVLRGLSANKETGLLFLLYLRAMDLPATKKVATQQIRKHTPHRVNVQVLILLAKNWRVQTMKEISFSHNVAVLHLSSISDKSSLLKMPKT